MVKLISLLLLAHFSASSVALALVQQRAPPHRNLHLPRNGHVAVLMLGQSFRCGHMGSGVPCSSEAVEMQLNATGTFKENVITPLEDMGNKVDIFYTDETCKLADSLVSMLGKRVKLNYQYQEEQRGPRVREALEMFKRLAGGIEKIESGYDLFIFTRHDLTWLQPLYSWTADWSLFNFPSGCSRELNHAFDPYAETGGCRGDNFYSMPGRGFGAFDSQIGQDKCWGPSGHACTDKFTSAMKERGILTGIASDGGLCNTHTVLCNMCDSYRREQCYEQYATGVKGHDEIFTSDTQTAWTSLHSPCANPRPRKP